MIGSQRTKTKFRCGFTLVELLVVIAIISVLIGMSLPAMQNMRELARRSNCEQNQVRLALAMSNYSSTFGHYPTGTQAKSGPILSEASGFHHNWASGLLPMLDAQIVFDAIDQSVSVYAKQNEEVRNLRIPTFICPSASDIRYNSICYSGVTGSIETPIDVGNNGVYILNRPISDRDITDGLGYTLFLGEKLSRWDGDLGWMSGTRSSLRDAGHAINADRLRVRGPQVDSKPVDLTFVGGFASDHPGGAYLLLGSGEYQFRSSTMDREVLEQMASRADGELPKEWKTNERFSSEAAGVSDGSEAKEASAVDSDAESGDSGNAQGEKPAAASASTEDSRGTESTEKRTDAKQ